MLKISNEERKMLLDYMARRPYAEVYQLISMLFALKPIEEKKKEENKKDNWWKIKFVHNVRVMVL